VEQTEWLARAIVDRHRCDDFFGGEDLHLDANGIGHSAVQARVSHATLAYRSIPVRPQVSGNAENLLVDLSHLFLGQPEIFPALDGILDDLSFPVFVAEGHAGRMFDLRRAHDLREADGKQPQDFCVYAVDFGPAFRQARRQLSRLRHGVRSEVNAETISLGLDPRPLAVRSSA
jgi:hypothetical protein